MYLIVIGTGYVGLVTGACFAELGQQVVCVDIDAKKVECLNRGEIPIYEPGLEEIVKRNIESNRLNFTTDLASVMNDEAVIFIAVGTPSDEQGAADLSYVYQAAEQIGRQLKYRSIIVDKSTVPVGTADKVRDIIAQQLKQRHMEIEFDVISNPEFLKEGKAVEDFMHPDRVVLGVTADFAKNIMAELYQPIASDEKILYMSPRDAEMTKYVANAMLAAKISFMNEMASLCDKLGVDVDNVRIGIGSDQRIGKHFIFPGCGYGGSCFPKDVKALIHKAKEVGFDPLVLQAIEDRNQKQKEVLFAKFQKKFGNNKISGITVAVLGLAFKPETDDMREASSIAFITQAIENGINVKAYDPVAIESARKVFSKKWLEDGRLVFSDNIESALKDADALVVVTEWQEFKKLDLAKVKEIMRGNVIIDGRNIYEPALVKSYGFEYDGIGRS